MTGTILAASTAVFLRKSVDLVLDTQTLNASKEARAIASLQSNQMRENALMLSMLSFQRVINMPSFRKETRLTNLMGIAIIAP